MAVTPNYSWPTPDDTALVKDGASAMRDLGDAIDASLFAVGSWQNWTPSWTSTGTAPSVGSGFIGGRFTQIGNLVIANGYIILGAGFAVGSGNYRVSFPVNAASTNGSIGSASIFDASASYVQYPGIAIYVSATTFEMRLGNALGLWSPTSPIPLTQSDQLRFFLMYEAA